MTNLHANSYQTNEKNYFNLGLQEKIRNILNTWIIINDKSIDFLLKRNLLLDFFMIGLNIKLLPNDLS